MNADNKDCAEKECAEDEKKVSTEEIKEAVAAHNDEFKQTNNRDESVIEQAAGEAKEAEKFDHGKRDAGAKK